MGERADERKDRSMARRMMEPSRCAAIVQPCTVYQSCKVEDGGRAEKDLATVVAMWDADEENKLGSFQCVKHCAKALGLAVCKIIVSMKG